MKKFFLLSVCLSCILPLRAQTLTNTEWFGTNPPSMNLYFLFGTDTLYYRTASTSYTALSLYSAATGQFTIADLQGTTLCTDTGFYAYAINGNTLVFSNANDLCTSRSNTLLNYSWTRINATGIGEPASTDDEIQLSYGPDQGLVSVSISNNAAGYNHYRVTDYAGRIILQNEFAATHFELDLRPFARSVYFFSLEGPSSRLTLRILK